MEDPRSRANGEGRMELESYYGGGNSGSGTFSSNGSQDLRCYSASYANATNQPPYPQPKELKKGKSTNSSISKAWCFSDPELQRKKRVASYKVYSAEGKMKGSFRKSFRWIKDKYSQMVNGW